MFKKLLAFFALACVLSAPVSAAPAFRFYVNGQELSIAAGYSVAYLPLSHQLTVGYSAPGATSCDASFSGRKEYPIFGPVDFDFSGTATNLPASYTYTQYFDPAYRFFRYDIYCRGPGYGPYPYQLIIQ